MRKETKTLIEKELNNIINKYSIEKYLNNYYLLCEEKKELEAKHNQYKSVKQNLIDTFLKNATNKDVELYKEKSNPVKKELESISFNITIQNKTIEAYSNILEKILRYILIDTIYLYIKHVNNTRDQSDFEKLINIYDNDKKQYKYFIAFSADRKKFGISLYNKFFKNFEYHFNINNCFLLDNNNNYYLYYDIDNFNYYTKLDQTFEELKKKLNIDDLTKIKNKIRLFVYEYDKTIENIKNIIEESNKKIDDLNIYGVEAPKFSKYI